MNVLGIDLSEGDGAWNPLVSQTMGVKFATIKATGGTGGVDTHYNENWAKAPTAGIERIAYHWYVPRVDPKVQAQWFVAHSQEGERPRMVDLEDNPRAKVFGYYGVADELRKFLDEVQRLSGERCLIYCNRAFAIYFRRPTDGWLSQYPLVVASWGASCPSVPWPWYPRWYAWQFTGTEWGPNYGVEAKECSLYVG
jgi:lysozyme